MSRAQEITRAFGGDWHGNYGAFPSPGHSKADRGMTVKDAEGDDVLFNSFNGGDWKAVRDECRQRGFATRARDSIQAAGGRAVVIDLPGLLPKGDVIDWSGTADELRSLTAAALAVADAPAGLIALLDPGAWATMDTPARVWALHEMILVGQVTYLTGAGATGKSLLGQQLATCIALGLPFMGLETRQGAALYLTCEDDADELHRRQKPICEALGASLPQLSGKLHLGSLAGAIGNELSTFDPLGRMGTTPAWDRLRATALATRASFIVLDNVAHLFSGNENIRNQVAAFLSLLNGLAAETGAAILLIGHPNKAGDSFSGSTAWENQVRSRLFLERPRDADGGIVDPDARLLSKGKANYSRNGDALAFRWHRWAFVREEDLPPDVAEQLTATIQANAENEAFLRCLAIATRDKQAVSHNRGTNYAPNIFAAMPEARKLSASSFERAMQRLRHIQQIRFDEPLWRGPNRVMKQGIKLASECTNPCTDPRTNPCTDPAPTPSDMEGDDCTDLHASTPLYPTGKSGPGLRAAGPDHEEEEEEEAVDGRTIFTAEHPNGRLRSSPILAPGESDDDPVPGWDEQEHGR